MAGKTSKFMVGLFVSLGIVITVVAIIWVGATKYFEKGDRYVTYFDESVQGLQKDSIVKYRGVEVGRVEQIRVAPDNHLIAVIMKVNLKEKLSKSAIAQLKVAGITGMVFVELDRQKPGEAAQSPKIGFPSEYPVIPSRPSEISRIMTGVNSVVDKFNQADTQGAVNQVKSTAAEIEIFFKGKDMQVILANLKALTANLKNSSERLDKTLAAGKLDDILKETRDTVIDTRAMVKDTRALMVTVQGQILAMNLPETTSKTQALIVNQIRAVSENLKKVSEKMDDFVTRINDRPPDLLFGKPPKKRFNE
ncbi:MAG: MlaD family protein [Deltaproteobacteria bacterium]|nr:MlaD family protein [Deltaproteobacteria bacterium]